jgi:formiminotetrahydrofolate cyclodeaminase
MYDRDVHPEGSTRFGDLTVAGFIERLASSDPVPGGGSASAVAASLGASLVAMVASLSIDRPKYAAHQELLVWARDVGSELADEFLEIADEDAEAYGGFAAALKLPRETDDEVARRKGAMQSAARRAAEVPLRCVELCLELAGAAEALAGRSNTNASSDLNVAALLAEAAARGAAANVLVNLPSVGEPELEGEMVARVKDSLDAIERFASETRQAVGAGIPRDPIPVPVAS